MPDSPVLPDRLSRFVYVDLTGSKLGPNFLSVEVELRNPGAFADRIREGAAEYYGVPLDQIGPLTDHPTQDD